MCSHVTCNDPFVPSFWIFVSSFSLVFLSWLENPLLWVFCFLLDLPSSFCNWGNTSICHPLSTVFALFFWQIIFTKLRNILSHRGLLSECLWLLALSRSSFCTYWDGHWILLLDDCGGWSPEIFNCWNHPWISEINPIWSWCFILFINC